MRPSLQRFFASVAENGGLFCVDDDEDAAAADDEVADERDEDDVDREIVGDDFNPLSVVFNFFFLRMFFAIAAFAFAAAVVDVVVAVVMLRVLM